MASSAVSQSHSGQLHPPAGSMMARVDRLDLVVVYLEEMRHGSARSSTSPSTPTTFSSSSPTTPRSTGRCRPAEELLRETKAKGSLVERIAFLENRVLRMEEERLEGERMSMERSPERTSRLSSGVSASSGGSGTGSGRKKKGLKSLVKSCVRGGAKLKTKD